MYEAVTRGRLLLGGAGKICARMFVSGFFIFIFFIFFFSVDGCEYR